MLCAFRRLVARLAAGLAFALSITGLATPLASRSQAHASDGARAVNASRPGLTPDDEAVAQLSPALRAQLVADPYIYFRFINVPWMRAVCEAFADVMPGLPVVRLHGDPHLEQYALTGDTRGLDDFDDSATGPYVVDFARFLASLDLALRGREWTPFRRRAMDAFFDGYRAAVVDPDYVPPEPAVVTRLRATHPRSPAAFLAWADSLMRPLEASYAATLPPARDALERYVRQRRPETPEGYFTMKHAGQLAMGVGSALTPKLLMRLEGPTSSDADDVILEAKRASDLGDVPCLRVAPSPAVRVVTGAEQIGRIHHELLVVLRRTVRGAQSDHWWVRSWDSTYREVEIRDYKSGAEVVEVARDVGAQLGRGHFLRAPPATRSLRLLGEFDRLAPQVRRVVNSLTKRLLDDWARFAVRERRRQ